MSGYLPDGTTQEMLDRAIADDDAYVDEDVPASVSYTHLTLPTIYSV